MCPTIGVNSVLLFEPMENGNGNGLFAYRGDNESFKLVHNRFTCLGGQVGVECDQLIMRYIGAPKRGELQIRYTLASKPSSELLVSISFGKL